MMSKVKKAYYRFVPIWFNEETCEVEPRKLWLNPILDLVLWWDMEVIRVEYFKIYVEKDNNAEDDK